jgi:hypothetical protein
LSRANFLLVIQVVLDKNKEYIVDKEDRFTAIIIKYRHEHTS